MRVLVACEYSGRVRDALLAAGHDAMSCDVIASDQPGPHYTGRVEDIIGDTWDMIVAFPPCTYLTNLGYPCMLGRCSHPGHANDADYLRWRRHSMILGAQFFTMFLAQYPRVPRVAVENPVPHPPARRMMGQPAGHSEPFHHGDPWRKRTCWWLRGLAPLRPSAMVPPRYKWVSASPRHRDGLPSRGSQTSHARALTPAGTAQAIAAQWTGPRETLF
jgi:hypothetical protein